MDDLLVINDFLSAAECVDIISEMRSGGGEQAPVYGIKESDTVNPLVRKVTRVTVSPETQARVMRQLLDRKREIENYFGVTTSECEAPQFLHYQTGDFFVAHQDGNTPIIFDETRLRKVSVVIFLNQQSDEPAPHTYGGGSLVLHGAFPRYDLRFPVANNPGTLAAFRAETTHEVTPVDHGERFTIASWYRQVDS
jgi:SM-20-related protein